MGRRGLSLLGTGLLVALPAFGCGATADRMPAVPAIENGRNARGADPCRLLTDRQAEGLGLTGRGIGRRAVEGPRCEWRGPGGTVLEVTLYTDGGGLATLARNSEPTTRRARVAGYPALETFTKRGEFCQYDVGIADAQAVLVAMEAQAGDSCSTLQAVVPMIAGNLPPVSRS